MTQHIQDASLNMQNENLEKLKAVFPNFVREDKIDFDALKEFFASENMISDDGTYGLSWNGKKQAYKNIAIPATGTLMFDEAESKDADTTKNIFSAQTSAETLHELYQDDIYRSSI